MQEEMQVRSLGQEDPLGKGLQYSCLENPTDKEACWTMGHKESDTTEAT